MVKIWDIQRGPISCHKIAFLPKFPENSPNGDYTTNRCVVFLRAPIFRTKKTPNEVKS